MGSGAIGCEDAQEASEAYWKACQEMARGAADIQDRVREAVEAFQATLSAD